MVNKIRLKLFGSSISKVKAHLVKQRHAFTALGKPVLFLGGDQVLLIVPVLLDGIFHASDVQPGHNYTKELKNKHTDTEQYTDWSLKLTLLVFDFDL